MLPEGETAIPCTQRLEVVAPDGTSCGSRDYPIAAGTCDTSPLTLAADGTVIQQLPFSMETMTPVGSHTCPGAGGRALCIERRLLRLIAIQYFRGLASPKA